MKENVVKLMSDKELWDTIDQLLGHARDRMQRQIKEIERLANLNDTPRTNY